MQYKNITELAMSKYEKPFKQLRVPAPLQGTLGAFVYERNLNMSKTIEDAVISYLMDQGWDFRDNPDLAAWVEGTFS